jgi:prephenate dehydrogenase
MPHSKFLLSSRVAIVGLGLMGGSLALALRDHCQLLLGVDPDPDTLTLAQRRHFAKKISADPAEILPEADVIVLAAPVSAILELIPRLPELHPGSPVVIDLGSTKSEICRRLDQLPERFEPLGGHPMCGKETSGLQNAAANLYQGAPFAFTPLERTSERARAIAVQLARAVGAQALWLEPETHDRWTAATSHLPYLASAALTLATPQDCAPMIGPGFRSATRLAGSSTSMMLDILITNQENVLEALARLRQQLDNLESTVRDGNRARLEETLAAAGGWRKALETAAQGKSGA